MGVDHRLQEYWKLAWLFHRQGQKTWLDLLALHARQDKGPGGRAAARLVKARQNKPEPPLRR